MRISVHGTGGGVQVRMRLDANRRRRLITRISLWLLAINGIVVGVWAVLLPEPWFRSFPGFGLNWVGSDGPYNHHLATDVGAFFLGFGALSLAALYYRDSMVARVAGIGWLVFGIPHLIYHVAHKPEQMGGDNYAVSLIAATLLPALAAAIVVAAPRERVRLRDPAPMTIRFPRRHSR
ncbi:hypothetical protein C5E45_29175 [Nocardia nova]|uniref:Uncharacterized protein n=1 Tax=Nocardia nova TaxID=37330 RepID=A0A2S6AHM5_9NOCA|nr:hypothetical protein [Nocardia nova]PPJ23115.1 hypothetical protein C5E41_25305 [Nocardia nova]PPJ34727.1 hypothetical protein C5E45_29175 [Nocardia nova]